MNAKGDGPLEQAAIPLQHIGKYNWKQPSLITSHAQTMIASWGQNKVNRQRQYVFSKWREPGPHCLCTLQICLVASVAPLSLSLPPSLSLSNSLSLTLTLPLSLSVSKPSFAEPKMTRIAEGCISRGSWSECFGMFIYRGLWTAPRSQRATGLGFQSAPNARGKHRTWAVPKPFLSKSNNMYMWL